jgi:hypothetical protein
MAELAGAVHLSSSNAGKPDLRTLSAPDRPVTIVDCDRGAGERASSYSRNKESQHLS